MKKLHVAITLFVFGCYAIAQTAPAPNPQPASNTADVPHHDHHDSTHEDEYGAAISYADLKKTADDLERVREATAKYRDVNVAEADGYLPRGAEIKGMGVHFVREMEPDAFHLEKPPMLVYETDASRPGGYSLVAVVYLLKGAEGPDGQPVNNPFPKPLAIWHHHAHVCMLSKTEHVTKLSEDECQRRGGHFNDEWMLHAWVWKDSPRGVFSPQNPLVATSGADVEVHTQ
jgi:hypothetical protein